MGVVGIQQNGMMDYPTAQAWVRALNAYNNGQGYLGHTNWQLPASPMLDSSCGSTRASVRASDDSKISRLPTIGRERRVV